MTVPGNYETRKAYREALVQILDTIRGVDSYYISLDQCIKANIIEPTPLVMLFSIMGPFHLRVLEAYYNGDKVVVRKTKLYDMRGYNPTTLDLLHRWWLGYACGETKKIPSEL
ncbi:hypothetical protein ATERTT37_006668 [Aspergillus terreus]